MKRTNRKGQFDDLAKSHRSCQDGLWKKFDILGVVSETATWQYIRYGESSFQIYNDVDRAFYESIKSAARVAIFGFVGLSLSWATGALAQSSLPAAYDNQGYKIFAAQRTTTKANLSAESTGRNLAAFYALRQYPGSPPRVPHEVDPAFSGKETECLSCHGKGGYSPELGKFVPVTPHPENTLCYQCHAQVTTTELLVETDWQSIGTPKLGLAFLGSSPPPVPHSLQMRENCIACHTGPAAVAEIQVDHAARGDCRQCHATVVQTAPLKVFERK